MALDKNTLKQNLIDNFTTIKNDTEGKFTQQDSANGLAQAIVDYAKDAEVIVTTPFIITLGGAPDASVVSVKLKVSGVEIGKQALVSQIMTSFKLMDPTMNLISLSIVTFAALMLNFSNTTKTINAVGTTIMAVPPIFLPSTKKGMDGGSIVDVCNEMAKAIDISFKSSIFTGAGSNSVALSLGVVVGPLV
jgi:hypothetical protein